MGAGIWLLQARHIQPYQVDVHNVSDPPTTFHHTVNCGVYTATDFDVILQQAPVPIPVSWKIKQNRLKVQYEYKTLHKLMRLEKENQL